MTKLPQEEWSDFACPTGPDTRQPDMVCREAVIELLEAAKDTPLDPPSDELEWLIEQVKSL